MKAMIFAAGLGTRLRPLTDNMPKALVPVGGKPMLERVILNLLKHGFNDITVNVHHFGEQIIDFLKANNNFGATIHISDERDELLDTGGGILKARNFLDGNEPFLVHNADILTDLNLKEFYNYHLENKADATLLTASRNTARYLLLDKTNRLHGWINKSTGEIKPQGFVYEEDKYKEMAFGGIHILSPSIFPLLERFTDEHKFSIIPFYLSACRQLNIYGYAPEGYSWFDIGKMETLQLAESWINR